MGGGLHWKGCVYVSVDLNELDSVETLKGEAKGGVLGEVAYSEKAFLGLPLTGSHKLLDILYCAQHVPELP